MNAPALRVAGLGKRYRLGLTHAGSLSEAANRWTRRLRGLPPVEAPVDAAPGAAPPDRKGEFWALRDVSFEIQPGEVVGVIGRNGAGKSTLLKVLSKVTAPTVGEVRVRGRVGSLLEVGTGFHPELTGRENVYMNATLLGMSKREVRARLDEIVAFSGVEKFLDTPVKRYSSGMQVRLGFAVAAHLEPEVLIVDEVLAVGDAEFQRRCLGKMKEIAGEGRTVLFVSHNMAAVRRMCSRVVALKNGSTVADGDPEEVIGGYLGSVTPNEIQSSVSFEKPPLQGGTLRLHAAAILNEQGDGAAEFDARHDWQLWLDYHLEQRAAGLRCGFSLRTADGIEMCGSNHLLIENAASAGRHQICCRFPSRILNAGTYFLTVGFSAVPYIDQMARWEDLLCLRIVDLLGHGSRAEPLPGLIRPKLEWRQAPSHDGLALKSGILGRPAAPRADARLQ